MSYQRKIMVRGRKGGQPSRVVYQALGGASDCGAGQTWYPNLVFAGITGQCATPAQAQAMLSSGQATGNLSTSASTDSSGLFGAAGQVAGSLLSGLFGPKPSAPVAAPMQSGMSTTTKIAIAGAGVLALALIVKSRG